MRICGGQVVPGCPVFLLGWDDCLHGQWGEAAGVDFDITKAIYTVSKCIFVSMIMALCTGLVDLYLDDIPAGFEGSGQRFEANQELVRVGRVVSNV